MNTTSTSESCYPYSTETFIRELILTLLFYFGTYFPLILLASLCTRLREYFRLRFSGVLVDGEILRQRRIMIQRGHHSNSSDNSTPTLEICLITVRYPSDTQWTSFCIKEFEVNKQVYEEALSTRALHGGRGSLALVRDRRDPKLARTARSVKGYLTPCCVLSTMVVYGLIFTFMAIWNWTLYDGSWYCLAPVWSVPLAMLTASYSVWKRRIQMKERTRVVPLDDAFPRGEEVSEDELSNNTSIRRTNSARSIHGAELVPIADVVESSSDNNNSSSDCCDGDDESSGDGQRTAILISTS